MLPDHDQPTDFTDDDPPCNPPLSGKSGGKHYWTYEEVQEDLVEARRLWRRAPGGGRWPFAGDGPWHLVSKETAAGDYDEKHGNEDAEARPLPLSRAELRMMEQISEWLQYAPERDRQLIVVVLSQLARGAKRVSWTKVQRRLDSENSSRGLGMRYSRAIAKIAQELTKRRVARSWEGEADEAEQLIEALRRHDGRPGAVYGTGERPAALAEWKRSGWKSR